MIDPNRLSKEFLDRCARIKETAISNAMAAGIDLHEMEITEWFSEELPLIFYHCDIKRRKDGF
jgi:hypothetical protein